MVLHSVQVQHFDQDKTRRDEMGKPINGEYLILKYALELDGIEWMVFINRAY